MTTSREEHEIAHGRKLFESGAEQIWGWDTPAGKERFKRRASWIIRNSGLKPGVKALEIGCGTGNFTEAFAESGAEILALDISNELLTKARKRNLPTTIQFACQSFDKLEMPEAFDAVIGSSVLHHLDINTVFIKIFRSLKPLGVMVFAEPNMLNPQIMLQKNIPWIKQRMGDSPDETAFFRWQIKSLLERAGFYQIEVSPLDWLHPAIPNRGIRIFQRAEKIVERLPIVREFAGSLYITAHRPL